MPAYLVAEIEITDPAGYAEYGKVVPATVEKYGGKFLVRGGKRIMKPKEGDVLPNLPKPIHMPQDHTFMNRLQWGLASVMAGLGGEGNWRRIAEPWIRGSHVPV